MTVHDKVARRPNKAIGQSIGQRGQGRFILAREKQFEPGPCRTSSERRFAGKPGSRS